MKKKLSFLSILVLLVSFASIFYLYHVDKRKYQVRLWHGLIKAKNFRDVGTSLNQCLNKEIFQEGLMSRSNKYFSGWSCSNINNPDHLFSLNFDPKDPHEFYCKKEDGSQLTGEFFNQSLKIMDIDNFKNWNYQPFVDSICRFYTTAIEKMAQNKKIHFHCEVGRDRTGSFAALLAGTMAEEKGILSSEVVDAIECDFQKTPSLEEWKRGRMKKFITRAQKEYGSVAGFLKNKCGSNFSSEYLRKAADLFVKQQ